MVLSIKTKNVEDVSKTTEKINKNVVSKLIMTKYEFDKIIGLRTVQLSNGSIPYVNIDNLKIKNNMDLRQIALQELTEGKMPFIIERVLPNNQKEYVRVKDLDLVAVKEKMH